ncbi:MULTISPECIES: tyrosine-type recombinase/integrase [Chitinophagaceae]
MSLSFSLSDQENKDSQIVISYENNTFPSPLSFKTDISVPSSDWDETNQRPKNIYRKSYKKLNFLLDDIRIRVMEYSLSCQEKGCAVSLNDLYNAYRDAISSGIATNTEETFLAAAMQYMNSRKDAVRHSTNKRYMVFFNLIRRFEGYIQRRLYLAEVGNGLVRDFLRFGEEEKYSNGTLYRTVDFIKSVLRFGEHSLGQKVGRVNLRCQGRQQKLVLTISESEIDRIRQIPLLGELMVARDWLLVSCYTGQRFSDFIHFSCKDLRTVGKQACLSFTQRKTGKDILLPLHPVVKEVLEHNGGDFPPPIKNISRYNHLIKAIAKRASICCEVMVRKRVGHRSEVRKVEKWQALSSHIGRRSFATNFYGRIPTPLLMDATGHSTEKMFLRYINAFDTERTLLLSRHFDRTHKEHASVLSM